MAPATDPATWGDLAELIVMLLVPTSVLLVVRFLNRRADRTEPGLVNSR